MGLTHFWGQPQVAIQGSFWHLIAFMFQPQSLWLVQNQLTQCRHFYAENKYSSDVYEDVIQSTCQLVAYSVEFFVSPVYDVLTGAVVSRLSGHDACVRDVSWHPYEDNIVSSSVSAVNANYSAS